MVLAAVCFLLGSGGALGYWYLAVPPAAVQEASGAVAMPQEAPSQARPPVKATKAAPVPGEEPAAAGEEAASPPPQEVIEFGLPERAPAAPPAPETPAVPKPTIPPPNSTPGKGNVAELAQRIDQFIQRPLDAQKLPTAPLADDAEFLRRAYLDLLGVIPPADKAVAFLDSKDPAKRAKLIDELLADPQFGQHFAEVWTELLITNPALRSMPDQPLTQWLQKEFNRNKPWNQLTHELLTATGKVEENGAARYFVHNGITQLSITDLTDSISSVFLGVQIKCAQCHNHPFAPWKKADYWGMAGFFTNVNYSYKDKGLFDDARPNFNRGRFIDMDAKSRLAAPKFLLGTPAKLAGEGSGRKVFADWLADPANPYLAPAAVNRMWAHFFGRGLVNPVDDLHNPDHPPSHPELFETLRAQFVASGFDLKHLIRAICASQAYQRTSKPPQPLVPGGKGEGVRGDDELYSRMAIKVMTAEQMFNSLSAILGQPVALRGNANRDVRKVFVEDFKTPNPDPTHYERGIAEILRLMNSTEFEKGKAVLIDRVMQRGSSPAQVIDQLYLTVLSRRPSPWESERMTAFVRKQPGGDLRTTYGQVLWVLLNCSEFMLNH